MQALPAHTACLYETQDHVSLLESLVVNLQELSNTVYEPISAPCHEVAPGAENNTREIYHKPCN